MISAANREKLRAIFASASKQFYWRMQASATGELSRDRARLDYFIEMCHQGTTAIHQGEEKKIARCLGYVQAGLWLYCNGQREKHDDWNRLLEDEQ